MFNKRKERQMTKGLMHESWARPTYKDLPDDLWSEVLPNLFQGGTDDADTTLEKFRTESAYITTDDFDTVVTAYAWANPVDWGVKEFRYCFGDGGMSDIDYPALYQAVDVAHADWKAGKKVLVRCQAGLNRSGLIMALVLIKEGYTAQDAIDLIRKQRGDWALCNSTFVKWLLNLPIEKK
jgi:protein-tyrosine phosphatase